jgi:hypothetical protein
MLEENYFPNSGSLESMEMQLVKEGIFRKSFVQKAEMGIIRDFFSKRGYLVDVIGNGRKLDETYHIEIINTKSNRGNIQNA